MKHKYIVLITAISILFGTACKQFEVVPRTILTQAEIKDISSTSVNAESEVLEIGKYLKGYGFCYGTQSNPTVDDGVVNTGDIQLGLFSGKITGLSPNTKYYIRPYIEEDIEDIGKYEIRYGSVEQSFTTLGIITDYDGNEYNQIKNGNQIWLQEDLRVTHYPDGTAIPHITDYTAWDNLEDNNTDDAYCFYGNDSGTDYGALYTYAAAIGDNWTHDNTVNQGVCPDGWHLPSDAEWTELTDYLGGEDVAGGKMKETFIAHWNSPNTGATNSSGFSALPGGDRSDMFSELGRNGYWWSSTEYSSTCVYRRNLDYLSTEAYRGYGSKSVGFSVRCVKD